ncbi:MAG: hypothetical protein ACI8W8_001901, partial [Rhodothermales bacterium]
ERRQEAPKKPRKKIQRRRPLAPARPKKSQVQVAKKCQGQTAAANGLSAREVGSGIALQPNWLMK